MTEDSQNNQNTVLVALDIAKKTHDAIIALPSALSQLHQATSMAN